MATINICATFPPFPTYDSIAQSVQKALAEAKLPHLPPYPFFNFSGGILNIKAPLFSGMTCMSLEAAHIVSELHSLLNASMINIIFKVLSSLPGFSDLLSMLQIPFLGISLADLITGNIDWEKVAATIASEVEGILGLLGLPVPLYGSIRMAAVEVIHLFSMLKNYFYTMCNNALIIMADLVAIAMLQPELIIPPIPPISVLIGLVQPIIDQVTGKLLTVEAELKAIYAVMSSICIPPFLAPQHFTYPLFANLRMPAVEIHDMIKHLYTNMSGGFINFLVNLIASFIPIPGITICIPIPFPDIPSWPFGIPTITIPSLPKLAKMAFKQLVNIEGVIGNAEHKAMAAIGKSISSIAFSQKNALQHSASVTVYKTDYITKQNIKISMTQAASLLAVGSSLTSFSSTAAASHLSIGSTIASAISSAIAPVEAAITAGLSSNPVTVSTEPANHNIAPLTSTIDNVHDAAKAQIDAVIVGFQNAPKPSDASGDKPTVYANISGQIVPIQTWVKPSTVANTFNTIAASTRGAVSSVNDSISQVQNLQTTSFSVTNTISNVSKSTNVVLISLDGTVSTKICGALAAIGKIEGKIASILSFNPFSKLKIPSLAKIEQMIFKRIAAIEAIALKPLTQLENKITSEVASIQSSINKAEASLSAAESKAISAVTAPLNKALSSVAAVENTVATAMNHAVSAIASVDHTIANIAHLENQVLSTINGTLSNLSSLINNKIANFANISIHLPTLPSIHLPTGIHLPKIKFPQFPSFKFPILSLSLVPCLTFAHKTPTVAIKLDLKFPQVTSIVKSAEAELAALAKIVPTTTDEILKKRIEINKKAVQKVLAL
jgi:hypothetical protein